MLLEERVWTKSVHAWALHDKIARKWQTRGQQGRKEGRKGRKRGKGQGTD